MLSVFVAGRVSRARGFQSLLGSGTKTSLFVKVRVEQ